MNTICDKCKEGNNIIEDDGQIVCAKCGLIQDENVITDEYEKRTFEGDEDQIKRVGPPETLEQIEEPRATLIVGHKGKNKIIIIKFIQ